jgi:predicted MFS family arabinose efflux permease
MQWRDFASWGLLATAYCVAFFQRVCLPVITTDLATDFGVYAQGIGVLASAYFWGYMLMQFPAGVLVDALGVRLVVMCSLATSTIGTLLFAESPYLSTAFIARIFISCGDALVFTALIKLVALRFRHAHFGFISGLSQLSGYFGGILAATPLALAVGWLGWRAVFLVLAGFLAVNFVMCTFVLPRNVAVVAKLSSIANVVRLAGQQLTHRQSWGCALTFTSHFATVTTVSGVWGIPMLMDAYGLARTQASFLLVVFMASSMVGSVVFGLAADRIKRLSRALTIVAAARLLSLLLLAPVIGTRFGELGPVICFSALGLITGGMTPLILKCVKSVYSTDQIGVGAAINTSSAGLVTAAVQPALGVLLESTWDGTVAGAAHVYSPIGYDFLIYVLAVISALGFLGPWLLGRKLG